MILIKLYYNVFNYLKRLGYYVKREDIENKTEADILLLLDEKKIIYGLPFTPVSRIPVTDAASAAARKI